MLERAHANRELVVHNGEPKNYEIAAFIFDDVSSPQTLKVFGEVDASNCSSFQSALKKADPAKPFIVDLTSCTYMDSSGIATLDDARKNHDFEVHLSTIAPLRRVFELTGTTHRVLE